VLFFSGVLWRAIVAGILLVVKMSETFYRFLTHQFIYFYKQSHESTTARNVYGNEIPQAIKTLCDVIYA
jgi:hypothetical protein